MYLDPRVSVTPSHATRPDLGLGADQAIVTQQVDGWIEKKSSIFRLKQPPVLLGLASAVSNCQGETRIYSTPPIHLNETAVRLMYAVQNVHRRLFFAVSQAPAVIKLPFPHFLMVDCLARMCRRGTRSPIESQGIRELLHTARLLA